MDKFNSTLNNMGYREDFTNKLEKSYRDALKDSNFKEMIEKINAPENILMKYTSLLEESSVEFSHCKGCKNIMECKNKIEGYAYLPKLENEKIIFNYKACKYKRKILNENAYQDNVELFNVTTEIKNAKMKDIYPNEQRLETIKYLKDFLDNYPKVSKGLYLFGNFGCGKSYLIAAVFNELAKKNVKSSIVFWPEFLRNLKASFGIDFNSKFEFVKKVPLLLIDDIGAENMTAWGRDEILCPILQYRMDEKLPTFFTSNLDLSSLQQHLSTSKDGVEEVKAGRIIERIKQLTTETKMVSQNLRK